MNLSVDELEIRPRGVCRATVRPPGSKSLTNRAVICAALANGRSELSGALDSEDTRVMVDALRQLGIDAGHVRATSLTIEGCGGQIPVAKAELYVANSGTTMRFLTAMLAACGGNYRLDGVPRMRERPIGDLLEALIQLGGQLRSEGESQCPPVVVESRGLRGGTSTIRGDVSSQFLSGLLMAAPLASGEVCVRVDGPLVSRPYVDMTLAVMQSFGVTAQETEPGVFVVPGGQTYQPTRYEIEPDASAASYFWAAAAITGGEVTVEGLDRAALQGDVRFCACLQEMGCEVVEGDKRLTVRGHHLRGIDVDMSEISDTVQTLSAVALFADGPTRISGVAHIRHKETDRIGDLARELKKLGAGVVELTDGLVIEPGTLHAAKIDTYDDHRMAMSLALVGLRIPGVVIRDPGCTRKTYPGFFADLEML